MPTPTVSSTTFPLGVNTSPFAMVADSSGNLWVDGSINVYKVNIASGALLATTPLTDDPLVAYIAFDGTNVWVMGTNPSPTTDNLVYILTNGSITSQFTVGAAASRWPFYVIFDGTFMWILAQPVSPATNSILTKMSLAGAVISTLTFPHTSVGNGPVMTFDGTSIWIVTGVGGNLYQVNAATATLTNTFPVSNYTSNSLLYGASFDGTNLWYTDGSNLIVIDPTIGALVASLPQTITVQTLTYDGAGNIWFVGNDGTNGFLGIIKISTSALLVPLINIDVWNPPSTSGPNQIYSDGFGNVWVSTIESTLIRSTLSFGPSKPPGIIDPTTIPVHHLPFCHRKECIFS